MADMQSPAGMDACIQYSKGAVLTVVIPTPSMAAGQAKLQHILVLLKSFLLIHANGKC